MLKNLDPWLILLICVLVLIVFSGIAILAWQEMTKRKLADEVVRVQIEIASALVLIKKAERFGQDSSGLKAKLAVLQQKNDALVEKGIKILKL